MRRLTIAAIAFFLATGASADTAALRELIAEGRDENRSSLDIDAGFDIDSQHVRGAVSRAVLAAGDVDTVVRNVAKTLKVPRTTAAALTEAYLRLERHYGEPSDEERPIIEKLLTDAVRQSPLSRDVLAFYFAKSTANLSQDQFVAERLPLVRALPDPGDAEIVSGALNGTTAAVIAADALRRDPDNVRLHQALTRLSDDALNATFGPVRLASGKASMRESWKAAPATTIALGASVQIGALAESGRAAEMLAVFDALPPTARDAIVAGKLLNDGQQVDVRPDLGAAAILSGEPARAKSFIAPVHPPADDDHASTLGHQKNELRMLHALLAQPQGDLYDILADTINSDARPHSGIWSIAFANLAERGGYPAVGTAVLRNANRWTGEEAAQVALSYLPDALRAELQETLDRDAASIAAIRSRAPQLVSSAEIQKRLASSGLALFAEKKVPNSAHKDAAPADCDEAEQLASTMHIPPGWYPIRLERDGQEVAGIAVSQVLDPSGEVGRGAYWVLHSRDGGQSWEEPLYTGLRENAPYVVLPASALPLLHGDHLEVEVNIHEIDPASITFPPVGLRTKREEKGLYLQIPWSALQRDSDDDGVTDLVEERMGTNPNAPDSDGDGIIDGNDGLPLVPLTAGGTAESEALATVLRGFRPGAGALIVGVPETEAERKACVVRASALAAGALFLIGDRSLFAPIDINRSVVVLTREEMEAYEAKFGPTYAADISLMIVRHDGKKALVVLNESWKEDVLELNKTSEGWAVTYVGGWIS